MSLYRQGKISGKMGETSLAIGTMQIRVQRVPKSRGLYNCGKGARDNAQICQQTFKRDASTVKKELDESTQKNIKNSNV